MCMSMTLGTTTLGMILGMTLGFMTHGIILGMVHAGTLVAGDGTVQGTMVPGIMVHGMVHDTIAACMYQQGTTITA